MSMINYASREINCKIVYYGPGLGGKTTNLEHVYERVQPNTRCSKRIVARMSSSRRSRMSSAIRSRRSGRQRGWRVHPLRRNLRSVGLTR